MPVEMSKQFLDPVMRVSEAPNPFTTKYDIQILQTSFPKGVKPDKKEAYLSKEQFEETFEMTIEEFYALKLWKQKELKKKKKLF